MSSRSKTFVIASNCLVLLAWLTVHAIAQPGGGPGGGSTVDGIVGTSCVQSSCNKCNFVVNAAEGYNDFVCCQDNAVFKACQIVNGNPLSSCSILLRYVTCSNCNIYARQAAEDPMSDCQTGCPGGNDTIDVNKCLF